MKFSCTKILVLTKSLMRLHLVYRCSLTTVKRKTLKWNFYCNNQLGLAGKQTQYRKNIKNWENYNFLIFSSHFWTVIISSKIQWPRKSSLWLGSTVLKVFFQDNTWAFAHFYGCVMVEVWLTEHSCFKKDFLSFTMKKVILLMFFHRDRSVFIKLTTCEFLRVKFSKT